MTEAQRDYLADLATQKGVRLKDTDNLSVATASAKIEGLKQLPDKKFREINDEETAYIQKIVDKAREELQQWTFTQ